MFFGTISQSTPRKVLLKKKKNLYISTTFSYVCMTKPRPGVFDREQLHQAANQCLLVYSNFTHNRGGMSRSCFVSCFGQLSFFAELKFIWWPLQMGQFSLITTDII